MGSLIDIIIIGGVIVLIVVRIMAFLRRLSARFSTKIEQTAKATQESGSEEKRSYGKEVVTGTSATPELTYELKIARENKSRQRAKQTAEKNSTPSDKAIGNKIANEVKSDSANEGGEFDLRQAVIYSEIMKPKYSDEEI